MDRREFLASAPLRSRVAPRTRAVGGTPLALVTADLESHVVAVDVSAGRVVRRLRRRPIPAASRASASSAALVAHTAEGRLTLIDSDLRVRPIRGDLGEPRYAAVSPDERFAYVTDSGRQEVAVVDAARPPDCRPRRRPRRVPPSRDRPHRLEALGRAGQLGGRDRRALALGSARARGSSAGSGRRSAPTTSASRPAAAASGSRPATAGGSRSTRRTGRSSGRSAPTRHRSTSRSWATAPSSRAATTPCCGCTHSTAGACARRPCPPARTTSSGAIAGSCRRHSRPGRSRRSDRAAPRSTSSASPARRTTRASSSVA